MKISLEDLQKKIAEFSRNIAGFWVEKNSWIFLSFWLILGIFVLLFWYFWIFEYGWNFERKENYRKDRGQGVVLDEKKLNKITQEMESRKDKSLRGNFLEVRDIFGINK